MQHHRPKKDTESTGTNESCTFDDDDTVCSSDRPSRRRIPTLVVGGTHSGVGKTTVACGLIRALVDRGLRVQPFKVGPDFLDGHHHIRAASPASSGCHDCHDIIQHRKMSVNLDGWLQGGRENVLESFHYHCNNLGNTNDEPVDVAVIEGVMGLHDGKDGTTDDGSTAQIARWLEVPVILVVDAYSMTRSVAALVLGYKLMDPHVRVSAVVCNNVNSGHHRRWIRQALEASDGNAIRLRDSTTGEPLLFAGALPTNRSVAIPERLLGLVTPSSMQETDDRYEALGRFTEEHLTVSALLDLATTAGPVPEQVMFVHYPTSSLPTPTPCRIGVAYDEAFSFYYADNLRLLEQLGGAELVGFSPLRDENLPRDLHALYLGGGYPELYAELLEKNVSVRQDVQSFARAGGPVFAECGGFMYLCQSIWTTPSLIAGTSDKDVAAVVGDGAREFRMCNIFPNKVAMSRHLKMGYYNVQLPRDNPLFPSEAVCRGQEFHYSELIDDDNNNPEAKPAFMVTAVGMDQQQQQHEHQQLHSFGITYKRVMGSYLHLHFSSAPEMVCSFCRRARQWKERPKVVSFVSAATEIVFALGADEVLAGVTSICDFPSEARRFPRKVLCRAPFDASTMSSEEVANAMKIAERNKSLDGPPGHWLIDQKELSRIEPKIAFVQKTCAICDAAHDDVMYALKECELIQSCRLVEVNPTSLEGMFESIETLANALEVPEKGEKLCTDLRQQLSELSSKLAPLRASRRLRVVSLEGLAPLCVGGGWLPDVKRAAYCVDGFGDVGGAPARIITWDELIAADPDVLVLSPCSASTARTLKELHLVNVPEFWTLRCVQQGNVYIFDHQKFSRPGPRLVEGIQQLACALHGIPPPSHLDTSNWCREVLKYECSANGIRHCTTELSMRFKPVFESECVDRSNYQSESRDLSALIASTKQIRTTRCSIQGRGLPEARSAHNMVAYRTSKRGEASSLILFGGELADGSRTADVYQLHAPSNGWSGDHNLYSDDGSPRLGGSAVWEYLQCGRVADENVPTKRSNAAAVVCGDYLLVFGGWGNGSECLRNCELLHLETLCWTHCSTRGGSEPSERGNPTLVYSDKLNQAFLFGGWNKVERLSDLWVLDMEHWQWREVPRQPGMAWPNGRTDHSAVLWKKKEGTESMVVFGGSTLESGGCTNELWELDLHSKTWTEMTSNGDPPSPRTSHAATVLGYGDRARMVVTGGSENGAGTSVVHEDARSLHLSTRSWSGLDEWDGGVTGRCRHTSVALDGDSLLIWGGYDGRNTVEENEGAWICGLGRRDATRSPPVVDKNPSKESSRLDQNKKQHEIWKAEVPVRESDLPADVLARAKKSRLPGALYKTLHRHAVSLERNTYIDPDTGYSVFTRHFLEKRPCCGNGCRHCPHGHRNVPPSSSITPAAVDDDYDLDW